jgi:hypothetical protein
MRSQSCPLILVALAGVACGRIGFRASPGPTGDPADAPAAGDDAPIAAPDAAPLDSRPPPTDAPAPLDASADASPAQVIIVDPGPHHLGDTPGGTPNTPEGTTVIDTFTAPASCGSATLSLDFIGPYGPGMDDEPSLTLNGSDLGHVFDFFPPFTDPAWTAAGGEYNGPNDDHMFTIAVELPCAPAIGSNVFEFLDREGSDDMFFDNVIVTCE